MELSITILEDEEIFSKQLKQLLKKWGDENHIMMSIHHFFSGESFLKYNYNEDELFFLDIDLKTMNGMDIAKQLRKDGFQGTIIFLTAFSEYVFEGYNVQALNYLLKPINYQKLKKCLQPIIKDRESSFHIFRSKASTIKIPYNKILAFTSYRHYVDIITQIPISPEERCTKSYRQKIALKNLLQQLPSEFIRCHRTVIININKVMTLTNTEVILSDGSVFPVSESYLKNIQDAFSELLD